MLPRRFNLRKIVAWLGQTEAYAEQKPGKIAGVLRKGMELVGQTGYTVINAADEAAMGAGTGAVAGALLAGSPTLGLGAAPGAISGAVAGGGIGLKAGMAKEVFAMEAGYAYHELKSMGVDDQPAKQIAIAVGAINAAIEFAQIGTLLKGLGKAVPTGYVSRMIARRLLAKGAAGRSAAALAAMAVDAAKETLQELGQESVAIAGTEFGAKMQGVNGLGKEQIAARLKDTALSSALGFLFLNIPGAVSGAHAANLPVLPGKYAAGTGGGEGELSTQNVTKGAGKTVKNLKPQNLMDELTQSGVKYTPDGVITVTKTPDGKLMWLEKGNSSSGLQHIIDGHATDFSNKGINDIPNFLNKTLQNRPVNTGAGAAGPFADYLIDGSKYRVVFGTNGYVVSFFPIYK